MMRMITKQQIIKHTQQTSTYIAIHNHYNVNGNKNVKDTFRGVDNKIQICKCCSVQVDSTCSTTDVLNVFVSINDVLSELCSPGTGELYPVVPKFSFVFVS